MSNSTDTDVTPAAEETEQETKRKAYSRATTRLRNENPTLWNEVLKDEYAKVGIEWEPKPTEEQKAKAQIEALLAAHPELRTQIIHNH